MNVLKKGTLMSVAATVAASVLILFSVNTVADEEDKSAGEAISTVVTQGVKVVETTAVIGTNEVKTEEEKLNKAIMIPPPPGPFIIEGEENNKLPQKKMGVLLKPSEPMSPIEGVFEKKLPSKPNVPNLVATPPVNNIEKPATPDKPLKVDSISSTQIERKVPEFKRSRPSFSYTPPEPRVKPVFKKVVPETKKPIVARTSEVIVPKAPQRIIAPAQPVNIAERPILPPVKIQHPLQQRQNQLAPDRPTQQYMYVPMPMYQPQYRYPPVPQNGGKVYAPIPNILTPQGAMNSGYLSAPKAPELNKGVKK